ncbi:MAG: SufD family Fe-S cluster assembly protein [Bdellovibrionaceae bacterium]|jgi:Fe-S cluster assembly protein SufD|nr:SufD family Fe-S cluster assembly protein [Pseudobdellovibrionaceae bacterium]
MKIEIKNGIIIDPENKEVVVDGNTLTFLSASENVVSFMHSFDSNVPPYSLEIKVKDNLHLVFIDEYEVTENAKTSVIKYHFKLRKHAHVDFLLSQSSQVKRSIDSDLAESASFEMINTFLKEGHDEVDFHCNLNGEHAEIFLKGIYLSVDKNINRINSLIEHHSPHTYSDQLYKGILDDNSQVDYKGCIVLHKPAQKSSSSQLNKNVLLTDKAKINSKPELKVFADDVSATHGSTVGELSPEELFYFQSRGINKEDAQKILLRGFLSEVAFKVRNSGLKSIIEQKIGEVV